MRRTLRRSLPLVVGVAITVCLPTFATADGPKPPVPKNPPLPSEVSAVDVRNQEIIESELVALQRYAEKSTEADADGYAQHSVDIRNLRVRILWKGPVPDDIAVLEGRTASGVTIEIKAAQYSENQVSLAASKVLDAGREGKIPKPSWVDNTRDFDGLEVAFPTETYQKIDRDAVAAIIRKITGVPTSVIVGEALQPLSRQDDSSPWYGGSGYKNAHTPICSTGFATLTPTGEGRLLSAAHCDPSGNLSALDRAGDQLTLGGGDVWIKGARIDSLVMDPVGGTDGYVHGGPWNAAESNPRFALGVGSKYSNGTGDLVCTSGANSGEHCSSTIVRLNVRNACFVDPDEDCYYHYAEGGPSSVTVAAQGDSGGPVYALRSDGRVSARGIINGGLDRVTCPSLAYSHGVQCFNTVAFSAINTILDEWVYQTIETTP